jgi:hypothetical protein
VALHSSIRTGFIFNLFHSLDLLSWFVASDFTFSPNAMARQSAPKLLAASEIAMVAAIARKLLFTVSAHEGFGEREKMGWSGIISEYFR